MRLQFSHQTEGGLSAAPECLISQGIAVSIGAESGNVARLLLVAAFGPTSPLAFLTGVTLYLMNGDVLESHYTKDFDWRDQGSH